MLPTSLMGTPGKEASKVLARPFPWRILTPFHHTKAHLFPRQACTKTNIAVLNTKTSDLASFGAGNAILRKSHIFRLCYPTSLWLQK